MLTWMQELTHFTVSKVDITKFLWEQLRGIAPIAVIESAPTPVSPCELFRMRKWIFPIIPWLLIAGRCVAGCDVCLLSLLLLLGAFRCQRFTDVHGKLFTLYVVHTTFTAKSYGGICSCVWGHKVWRHFGEKTIYVVIKTMILTEIRWSNFVQEEEIQQPRTGVWVQ